jgi:hypothetical protein
VSALALACKFGKSLALRPVFISSFNITCLSPPVGPKGARVVSLEVTNNAFEYTNDSVLFEYAPEVLGFDYVSPSVVESNGGCLFVCMFRIYVTR